MEGKKAFGQTHGDSLSFSPVYGERTGSPVKFLKGTLEVGFDEKIPGITSEGLETEEVGEGYQSGGTATKNGRREAGGTKRSPLGS